MRRKAAPIALLNAVSYNFIRKFSRYSVFESRILKHICQGYRTIEHRGKPRCLPFAKRTRRKFYRRQRRPSGRRLFLGKFFLFRAAVIRTIKQTAAKPIERGNL